MRVLNTTPTAPRSRFITDMRDLLFVFIWCAAAVLAVVAFAHFAHVNNIPSCADTAAAVTTDSSMGVCKT